MAAHITQIIRRTTGIVDFYDGVSVVQTTDAVKSAAANGNDINCTLADDTIYPITVEDLTLCQVGFNPAFDYPCSPVTIGTAAYTQRRNDIIDCINNVFPKYATLAIVQQMIDDAPGGSTNIKQAEVDFGATPIAEQTFTVIDAEVSDTSQLIARQAYEAATGKDLDENEMDSLDIQCAPASGQFTLYIRSTDGSYLHDKFKINYLIG
jgi:hypothetical protein